MKHLGSFWGIVLVQWVYMTNLSRIALALFVPALLFSFAPSASAAEPLTLTVKNVTMVPKPPTCEARATKKVIRSGGSFELKWKSKGAEHMYGLTEGKQWPADGKQRVSIAVLGKHEFPLTFVGKNGAIATCPVTVFVHPKRK